MPDSSYTTIEQEAKIEPSLSYFGIKYGALTGLLLIGYFLTVINFWVENVVSLRYFNLFILIGGVLLAFRQYYKNGEYRRTNYLNGFLLGLLTAMISGVILAGFVLTYLEFFRPDIGLLILEQIRFGQLTIEALAMVLFLEATFSGIMVAFVCNQYFKNVRVEPATGN